MEDFKSKYTGAQVEELLGQIANEEVDNVYVTDFTIYDLLDVLDTGVSKSVDAVSLFAAIEANKIIIVPENDSNPLGGYVADTSANESCYTLYINYSNTYIELVLSQHSSTEITPLDVYKVDMQEMLISGETIKTINGEEVLGGGDIELATKSALNDKVDKVIGKGLSTEDFTSALKSKLEGLSNYDDTALANAISGLETRLNTLVSGDASTAIESFNEIMAFLDGIKDTQDLAGIVAAIEQQIAGKYTKPSGGIPASDLAPDVFLQGEKGDKGDKGDTGATGPQGPQGVGVTSVVQTTTSSADGGSNVVTVTLSDGKTSTFSVKNGSKGSQGEKGDKGDKGDTGAAGTNGTNGTNGATFTPSVDANGNLSWTNDKGLANPATVNIKGPKGDKGDAGSGGSGGGSGAYAEVNHGTSDTTFALTPNTFHVWDEVNALTLTLGSETAGVANEYLFQFTSGATATSLALPDTIKWANNTAPTIVENTIYQISILNGLASVMEFLLNTGPVENRLTLNNNVVTAQYPVASSVYVVCYAGDGEMDGTIQKGETSCDLENADPFSSGDAEEIGWVSPEYDDTYIYVF